MTTRFEFGKNWLKFAVDIHADQMMEAKKSVARLLGRAELDGLSFLDIGSGSGLFSLAARKMGARVTSFDVDPDSVACTRAVRDRHCPNDPLWTVERGSILDSAFVTRLGMFDIVYSWGVLHHTGAMWSALENAACMMAPSGLLAIALYRRTPLCWAWRIEKRCYASAPRLVQSAVRGPYKVAYLIGKAARGHDPSKFVRDYRSNRGMDFHRDVHDWLGGYPYESASADKVKQELARLRLQLVRSFEHPVGLGIFGTGCDEYVCQRSPVAPQS
jgi:2-polyprenyl-6-hydroxyphenyl methylase/3-demethylubiquinone-9 3-methyltransferase